MSTSMDLQFMQFSSPFLFCSLDTNLQLPTGKLQINPTRPRTPNIYPNYAQ
jgi:hypothetical protein